MRRRLFKHPSAWSKSLAKRILLRTLAGLREGYLEVICPRETHCFGEESAGLRATLVIHDERMFARALFGGDIGFGEAYMDGDWSSPDLRATLRLMVRNLAVLEGSNQGFSGLRRTWERLLHWMNRNSLPGSRKNISYHYDLGNSFYRLFLDRHMAYSCGYYLAANDSLEMAQQQKFDRICRKLRLGPSDHILEIGTGWGGFAVYAATHYGCRVTTTTISREQHDYARDWLQETGQLGKRVELLFEDYRNLRGRFDKLVSIEMFEAVGFDHYDDYFGTCDRLLTRDGSMLLQTITLPDQRTSTYRRRADWMQKYIFPGSALASLEEILGSLRRVTGLTLYHAEDIGMHYARTLQAWRERFLAAWPQVRALGFSETFRRMWEYYLAGCEASFLERSISNFQLLFTKTGNRKPLLDEHFDQPLGVEAASLG